MSRRTRRSVAVAERHVIERHLPGDRRHRLCVGRVQDRRAGIDDLEDPGDRAGPLSELAVQAGDGPEAGPDRDAVQEERGQRVHAQRSVDDLVARVPEQDRDRTEPRRPMKAPKDARHSASRDPVATVLRRSTS